MGNAKDVNVVIPSYDLIEYSDNYLKTPGSLWKYQRDEQATDPNGNIIDFPDGDNNDWASFKYKQKIAGQAGNDEAKDVDIIVPLKY